MNAPRVVLRALIILVCVVLGAPLGAQVSPEAGLVDKEGARLVWQELRRCPCWLDFREDETEFRTGITRLYRSLSPHGTGTIREGIRYYLSEFQGDRPEEFSARAKVFAFLRVVFDVPEGYLQGARAFGSWGAPWRDGQINLLWPYSLDSGGGLSLTGVFPGEYAGPPYDALGEFDSFVLHYPRRK